jgi:REP element-mobilizing transposase RayT
MEPSRYYHVYNRGNIKENLFLAEENYQFFLELYRRHIKPIAATYAYCLLPNHFHLLIRVRDPEEQALLYGQNPRGELPYKFVPPAHSFGHLFNAYTKAFNKWRGRTGSLFQKNFKRKEVATEGYFTRLIHYIHQNPQRHGLLSDYREWPHSSYHSLLSPKPTRLQREQVLGWFGGPGPFEAFHWLPHRLSDLGELLLDE